MTHLMLCQIGPVQAFIAAGRRTADLYVGSKLLSQIAAAGVDAAQQTGADMIFPTTTDMNDETAASVPHRFAFLTEYEPVAVAAHVRDAVVTRWDTVANDVRDFLKDKVFHSAQGDWYDAFERTKNNWLEFYWVALPYEEIRHGEIFREAGQALAQRKNMRQFHQIEESGWKCTLTGASSALPIPPAIASSDYRTMRNAWQAFSKRFDSEGKMIRPSEMLGAQAVVKRFAFRAKTLDRENFPSTHHIAGLGDDAVETEGKEVEGYFAVLHMDGDKMGAAFSQLADMKAHQEFSSTLERFARVRVPQIIAGYNGVKRVSNGVTKLVYAGGDDVLALLPLRSVLACADEIRRAYAETLGTLVTNPTMSAGIAIVPENYPLDMALDLSRRAEHMAKESYGRDAVVLIEAHGSGGNRTAGAKWQLNAEDSIAALVDILITYFAGDDPVLSAKLGFDLQETLVYALTLPGMQEARAAEVRRLLKRRSASRLSAEERDSLIAYMTPLLTQWGEHPSVGWDSLTNWIIFARFLASDGKVRA